MNRYVYSATVTLLVATACALAQESPPATPTFDSEHSVTLYRDRALVSRAITVPAGGTSRSVEVRDLPEQVIVDSLFADGDDNMIVRAVQVSPRPIEPKSGEKVQALDAEVAKFKGLQANTQQALQIVEQNLTTLDKMISFAGTAAETDRTQGVLDANALTTFSMDEHRRLANEKFLLEQESAALGNRLQLVQRQRDKVANQGQTIRYQATIFVETTGGEAGRVRLSYLVGGCSWSPQYTVRGTTANAKNGEPNVEILYGAVIQQMSGEDWHDVRLTLSTSSPSISAARPLLTPLRMSTKNVAGGSSKKSRATPFADPFDNESAMLSLQTQHDAEELFGAVNALRSQRRQAESESAFGAGAFAVQERDLALNAVAGKLQQIELQAEAKSWRAMAADVNDDVASQVYVLPQSVSLNHSREQQFVRIVKANFASEMYHVATPLLSTYAYREAELINTQPIGLLGGPATVYLNGRFVGRTRIPSTASGQRLTIGFDADQQVRTRRELRSKRDTVQGGNRHLDFTYRLVLANFKDQPVTVRLTDRLPTTRQSQQLSIQMSEMKEPLSSDGLYQRVSRPNGVLRWDLTVPADRHGSKAFDVEYSYALEFDRNQVPTTQYTQAEMRSDYEAMNLSTGGGGFGGGFGGGGGMPGN